MPELTVAEMKARGFSAADIAASQRFYSGQAKRDAAKPKGPPPRARDARTPKDFLLNLLRGNGL